MRLSLLVFVLLHFSLNVIHAQYPSFDKLRGKVFTDLKDALREPLRVYHLDLSEQKLSEIPAEVAEFQNLLSLNLALNQISSVDDFDFGQLRKLVELNMEYNDLTAFPQHLADQAPNLLRLYLNNNRIAEIPLSFKRMQFLEELELHYNKLSQFPDIQFKHLLRLRLDHNAFAEFPLAVLSFRKLRYLSLNGNSLERVPDELTMLGKLESLNLGDNLLTQLPKLSTLAKLRKLILDWNRFAAPEQMLVDICQLRRLEILSLENCGIGEIPKAIGDLRRLEQLSLINNKISTLPESLTRLRRLDKLWIGGNNLSDEQLAFWQNTLEETAVSF